MRPSQLDRFRKFISVSGFAVTLVLIFFSFLWFQHTKIAGAATPATQENSEKTPKKMSADLYAAEPEPLSPVECGKCHTGVFRDLKTDGGRHKFLCQNCHKNFHAYSPEKKNWQELMPKCSDCHTMPHGEKFAVCSLCHGNPHAVARMPLTKTMLDSCSTCHRQASDQLQKFPSAHSKLSCGLCHTSHGYKPDCSACHKPHLKDQNMKTCASECHPVHMPREIVLKVNADAKTCSVCHDKVYSKWSQSRSKHAKINCALCHVKHRSIPSCSACHKAPHNAQLLGKYPKCLTCHQDAHDMPVK